MPFQYPQTDAHVHPDFSIDAKGSLADYCERALEIGLHEIIFTTHIDTNGKYPDENQMVVDGKRIDISAEGIKRYAEEVWKAKEKYYDIGLMVKCGVEVDFYPGIDEKFLRIFEDRLFEYKLAGIHRVWDYCIGYENETLQLFADKDVNEILREYYSTVKSVAEMKFFDTIAHLDYYRRFAPVEKRDELLVSDFDFVHEALDSMVENAIGLEVNT